MAAAPNLTKVTRLGIVNAYLVVEEDGLTLVDTTLSGGAKPILGAAEALGLPIVRIALTHTHGDHVGQLDALAERLPGIEIAISERDAPLLEKDETPRPGEPADAKYRGYGPGDRPRRRLSYAGGAASSSGAASSAAWTVQRNGPPLSRAAVISD